MDEKQVNTHHFYAFHVHIESCVNSALWSSWSKMLL